MIVRRRSNLKSFLSLLLVDVKLVPVPVYFFPQKPFTRILNDDLPGTFEFDKRGYFVKESCGEVVIVIIRNNGTDGDVRVTCATREKTAVDRKDYQGGTFDILFRSGETTKLLMIPIIDDMSATEKEEC